MSTSNTSGQSRSITHAQELLDQNRDAALVFLSGPINELFAHTDEAMMDFAAQAQSNAMQGHFFEAMVEMRKHRNGIEQRFRAAIIEGFANFGAEPRISIQDADRSLSSELTLIEPDEMEEFIAGEKLVYCVASQLTYVYSH